MKHILGAIAFWSIPIITILGLRWMHRAWFSAPAEEVEAYSHRKYADAIAAQRREYGRDEPEDHEPEEADNPAEAGDERDRDKERAPF